MDWSVAEARARFAEVLHATAHEPQVVLSRGRRVAVVVAADEFAAFQAWRAARRPTTMAEAIAEIQRICQEEDYEIELPPRRDRPNAFAEDE